MVAFQHTYLSGYDVMREVSRGIQKRFVGGHEIDSQMTNDLVRGRVRGNWAARSGLLNGRSTDAGRTEEGAKRTKRTVEREYRRTHSASARSREDTDKGQTIRFSSREDTDEGQTFGFSSREDVRM